MIRGTSEGDNMPQDLEANLRHDREYGFNPVAPAGYNPLLRPPYYMMPPNLLAGCENDEQATARIWEWHAERI